MTLGYAKDSADTLRQLAVYLDNAAVTLSRSRAGCASRVVARPRLELHRMKHGKDHQQRFHVQPFTMDRELPNDT